MSDITLISKLLNFIGTTLIGSPEQLAKQSGLPIGPNFYYTKNDRHLPLNITNEVLKINALVDSFRRALCWDLAFKNFIFVLVFGYGVLGVGVPTIAQEVKTGIAKTSSALSSAKRSITNAVSTDKSKAETKAQIKREMNDLAKKGEEIMSKGAAITPDEQKQLLEMEKQYKELKQRSQE